MSISSDFLLSTTGPRYTVQEYAKQLMMGITVSVVTAGRTAGTDASSVTSETRRQKALT